MFNEKQKIFKTMEGDEDFINIDQDEKDSCIQVFFSRDDSASSIC